MNRFIGIIISLGLIIFGVAGAVNIVLNGENVMGTTDSVPWGILISGYEYFVGISTGLLLVAAIGYIFNLTAIKVIAKPLVLSALFTMISAFAVLLIELGNPINMYQYFLSPNFSTPLWWMAPLYSAYLVLLIVLIFYMFKSDEKKIKFVVSLTAPVAIIALMNIGFLFGFLNARPYWNGPFSPIYFVVTAFFSGIAFAAIIAYYQSQKEEVSSMTIELIRKFFISSIVVVALMVASKIMTSLYGGASGKSEAVQSFLSGPLAFNFWTFEIMLGMALPLLLLIFTRNAFSLALAGLMSLIGILFMRIDMVIAGQLSPLKVVYGGTKEVFYHTYTALWSEWALIIGGVGITLLLYLLKDKLEGKVKTIINKSAA